MVEEILLAALPIETQNLTNDIITTIYTGVGKVNASIKAVETIHEFKPHRIINYGTAGSHVFNQGTLVDCTSFVQRDMDVTGLGFKKYETPFEEKIPSVLKFETNNNLINQNATCYTGDSFLMEGADAFQVVDMEAYAIAKVCYLNDVEFIAYKYITDGADENSALDWEENCKLGAKSFADLIS